MAWTDITALGLGLAVAPCQLCCAYCDAAGFVCTQQIVLQEFEHLAREFAELGARHGEQTLSLLPFNEPANHPDLAALWSAMGRLGLSALTAVLATNGGRLAADAGSLKLLAAWRGAGLRTVQFTAYGLEETHDRFAAAAEPSAICWSAQSGVAQRTSLWPGPTPPPVQPVGTRPAARAAGTGHG